MPATDLSEFDDLTVWHRSDVGEMSHVGDGLRLRLALGSAALPIGAPGNDWGRYFIGARAGHWSYLTAALDDLPAAVRTALTTIELQVVSTDGAPHQVWLDGLEALAAQMVTDSDAALLTQLDGQLQLGGNAVPAVIVPDAPAGPAQPVIRLRPYETVRSTARWMTGSRRTDYTDAGHRLRPLPEAWDLFYAIECDAVTRAEQAAMVDFVVGRLGTVGWLPVGNRAFRIDQIDADEDAEDVLIAPHVLRYRIGAFAERAPMLPSVPVADLEIEADLQTGTEGP